MSPLMMLLALTLSLLTAATQPLNGADLYTLFPSDPTGDVLNVTQCYCKSSNPLSPEATFGYYVRVQGSSFVFTISLALGHVTGRHTLLTSEPLIVPFQLLELSSEPHLLHLSELHLDGASQPQRYKARQMYRAHQQTQRDLSRLP